MQVNEEQMPLDRPAVVQTIEGKELAQADIQTRRSTTSAVSQTSSRAQASSEAHAKPDALLDILSPKETLLEILPRPSMMDGTPRPWNVIGEEEGGATPMCLACGGGGCGLCAGNVAGTVPRGSVLAGVHGVSAWPEQSDDEPEIGGWAWLCAACMPTGILANRPKWRSSCRTSTYRATSSANRQPLLMGLMEDEDSDKES